MLNHYYNFYGILGDRKNKRVCSIHSFIRTLLLNMLTNELCHFYEDNMFCFIKTKLFS